MGNITRNVGRGAAAVLAVAFALWFLYSIATKGRYQHLYRAFVLDTQTGCVYFATGNRPLEPQGCP